jgi:hypothetical protein
MGVSEQFAMTVLAAGGQVLVATGNAGVNRSVILELVGGLMPGDGGTQTRRTGMEQQDAVVLVSKKLIVMKLRIELLIAFFMISTSTWAQKIEERHQGNVYVLDKIVKDGKSDYSYNYPILALRIDSVLADTLHIKYLFGKESFLDADFLYGDSCNCYVCSR